MPSNAHRVVLYSRPNCPLCDEALEQIELARSHAEFELSEVNILGDLELYESYKLLIPVITVDGRVIARYRIRWEDLLGSLGE